jgi:hypothetical protein
MQVTWEGGNWQKNKFTLRHLTSLFLSSCIVLLVLLIPVKLYQLTSQSSLISVTLIKQSPQKLAKQQVQVKKIKVTQKQIKPLVSKQIKTVVKSRVDHKKRNTPNQVTTIHRKAKQIKENLPSAGAILNLLAQKSWRQKLDKDFQAASPDSENFIMKSIVPLPQTKMFQEKRTNYFAVKDTQAKSLAALKFFASYLSFVPIDDVEKTQDMQPYCFVLGRNASYCPTNNPLED